MRIITDVENNIWEDSLNQYSRLIFTICYSMTKDYFQAEDLAQETFLAAYRSIDRFDGQNMKAWLTRIASNKCKDYLKSAGRRIQPAADESFLTVADRSMLPEDRVVQNDVEHKIRLLCGKLKEPYRAIAFAHFAEGKTAGEIAGETGKNIKTVQTQIYRAKAMLKKEWKEEFI